MGALLAAAMAGVLAAVRVLTGSLILVGIAVNIANVIGRYVFLAPIVWAEEVLIYLMVWTVFAGAVLVTWDGGHLKMDLLSVMLPRPWKQIVNAVAAVAFVLISVFVLAQSVEVVRFFGRLGQVSTVAEIPMVIPHAAVPVGFGLMLLVVLYRFRSLVAGTAGEEIDAFTLDSGTEGEG